jgi:hypothetical protein
MLILFDHGTPRGVMRALVAHTVITAFEKGWDRLNNGALLQSAKENGFEVFLTTDRRIQYHKTSRLERSRSWS